MRHRVFGKILSRDANERKSLLKNLVSSLITYGYIKTTESKAKAVKGLVDKLVTQAKNDSKNTQGLLMAFFQNKKVVDKLMGKIAPSCHNRQSGFTRIIRLGQRVGDRALMVRMELVEGEKLEVGNEKLDAGSEKVETGDRKPKVKVPKPKAK